MPEEEIELLEADAFLRPNYTPKDDATREKVEQLADELGVPKTKKHIDCLSSFILACRTAEDKGSNLIAFSGNSNDYIHALFARGVAVRVRDALIANGRLKPVQKQSKGHSIVYSFDGTDLSGRFQHEVTWPVRVREPKPSPVAKGRLLTRREAEKRFKRKYREQEGRIKKINRYYAEHPLCSEDKTYWAGVHRIFNEGRLDRGGRLYGGWQQLKEEKRLQLTIDGEDVVEIDITACFLFIASALSGVPISDRDPYQTIPWVTDKNKRNLAKRLTLAMISMGRPLTQFSAGVRDEFFIPKAHSLAGYQDPILTAFPVLNDLEASGMAVMYRESEIVFRTIEELAQWEITAYPVHDCLIVAERHWRAAARTLLEKMDDDLGCRPWLTIGYKDGREDVIDPETM